MPSERSTTCNDQRAYQLTDKAPLANILLIVVLAQPPQLRKPLLTSLGTIIGRTMPKRSSHGRQKRRSPPPASNTMASSNRGATTTHASTGNHKRDSESSAATKTVWLVRHGQSLGQTARMMGLNRKTDPSLRDCGLTRLGVQQAKDIPRLLTEEQMGSIQLVVSSPLTRALHTAMLGFRQHDIVVQHDLREMGSGIPENWPRKMETVLRELDVGDDRHIVDADTESSRPTSGVASGRDRASHILQWLYDERSETTIAIVCHFYVIKALLQSASICPVNAEPIRCTLHSNGELEVA